MSDDPAPQAPPNGPEYSVKEVSPQIGSASKALFALLVCAAVFGIVLASLREHQLHQGIAMFVGLPLILGTIVTFATYPRSPLGMVFKVTTLVLCIIAP